MQVETVALDSISQDPANVRRHSARNLDAIRASLRAYGQQKPIVVDGRGIILAGNGTYEAAKSLGWESIAAVRTGLAGVAAVGYALADNRTAELAEWDYEALADSLKALSAESFDLSSLGWAAHELEPLLAADWSPPAVAELPGGEGEPRGNPTASAPGDPAEAAPGIGPAPPIAVTAEQRETIDAAVAKVRELAEDDALGEGRCVELIAARYLGEDR